MSEETARRRIGQEIPPEVRGPIQPVPQRPVALVGPSIDVPAPGVSGMHVSNDGGFSVGADTAPSGSVAATGSKDFWQIAHNPSAQISGYVDELSIPGHILIQGDATGGSTTIGVPSETGGSWSSQPYIYMTTTDAGTNTFTFKNFQFVDGDGTPVQVRGGYVMFSERSAPSAPSANQVLLYCADNGGKTTLYALFPTGDAQVVAAEP